jgi:hypothetical protein
MEITMEQCKWKKKVVVEHVGKEVLVDNETQMYRWMYMVEILY